MLAALAEFLVEVVLNFFLGVAPERPIWLRRFVQAFWVLLLLAVLAAAAYGFVGLVKAVA